MKRSWTCTKCGKVNDIARFKCNCEYDNLDTEIQAESSNNIKGNASKQSSTFQAFVAVIGIGLVIGMAWFFFGGGLEKQTAREIQNFRQQQIKDTIEQYNIARNSKNYFDAALRAGVIANHYLEEKDEEHYNYWKKEEKRLYDLASLLSR